MAFISKSFQNEVHNWFVGRVKSVFLDRRVGFGTQDVVNIAANHLTLAPSVKLLVPAISDAIKVPGSGLTHLQGVAY